MSPDDVASMARWTGMSVSEVQEMADDAAARDRELVMSAGEVEAHEVGQPWNARERWIRLERSPHLPAEVADLTFCFVIDDGGQIHLRAIALRTIDDVSPTSTLLRDLPLAALEADARSAAAMLIEMPPLAWVAPGAGRAGHSAEFLHLIYRLYRYALNRHPRRPIAWMHEEGLPEQLRPQSIETVRTWVRQAKALAESDTATDTDTDTDQEGQGS